MEEQSERRLSLQVISANQIRHSFPGRHIEAMVRDTLHELEELVTGVSLIEYYSDHFFPSWKHQPVNPQVIRTLAGPNIPSGPSRLQTVVQEHHFASQSGASL